MEEYLIRLVVTLEELIELRYMLKDDLSKGKWVVLFLWVEIMTKPNMNKWTKPNWWEYIRVLVVTNSGCEIIW